MHSQASPPGTSTAVGTPAPARTRVLPAVLASTLWGLLLSPVFTDVATIEVIARTLVIGLCALLVFMLLERRPRRLPRWVARWALRVIGVAAAIPFAVLLVYLVDSHWDEVPFWRDYKRLFGFFILAFTGMLFAPWVAVSALLRHIRGEAQRQQLAFELERSNFARQALDARLRLLQAQVAPHFLFNTLANVQALVETGSAEAPAVLRALIAYLRAAVPRLHEPATTLGQELELVGAYLELMHMRMPDRLRYSIEADAGAHALRCPPMTLLTLVENAVRHGIDPSEEGGRIDIAVRRRGQRCLVQVTDTGLGLHGAGGGLGTGLATLRERLQLVFGDAARLSVTAIEPQGVRAEIEFPAEEAAA